MHNKEMTIYCAHPISGQTQEDVFSYYQDLKLTLEASNYNVLQPMTGKKNLRTEVSERSKPSDYKSPVASNHAIFERDRWMVTQSDVVLVDLMAPKGSIAVSIGCMMELAWASILNKHTVIVLDKGSIYEHAFVLEAADIIFHSLKEAIGYLKTLSLRDF